jgi:hypothetical protein
MGNRGGFWKIDSIFQKLPLFPIINTSPHNRPTFDKRDNKRDLTNQKLYSTVFKISQVVADPFITLAFIFTYCFIRMSEGLKNAGSTFSCLTKTVLESQVGQNIFTYVDDIVVASKNKEDHLADLTETFANMRDARLRLNPEKCVFGVRRGKILGYLVSHRGIEANPTKIQAIINMTLPQLARDVQRLTGRLVALNRFISKSAERSLPFLKTLRDTKDFAWGPEQAAAFASLKQHMSELAILTSPNPSLPLLLYVAASPHVDSAALVQEQTREGTTRQCPVYYVFEVLTTSKCNMTELKKLPTQS